MSNNNKNILGIFILIINHNNNILALWSTAQILIGFGTVACMCCALFLGLKLKWFRAQFKVQDMPKTKKSSETVQGIGFKIKSNSDDFQQYKSISGILNHLFFI